MKIKSLSHTGITVRNFDRAVKWYWEVFRLPLVSEGQMSRKELAVLRNLYRLDDCSVRFGFLLCPRGGVVEIFEFSRTEEPVHRWNSPGATHFTMDVKNIRKWHDTLAARKDVEILCPPQNTDGNEWFFFRDPDGNLIELIDLKFNYFVLRVLGKITGFFMRKGPYKNYYTAEA